jgi:hypothetical protein
MPKVKVHQVVDEEQQCSNCGAQSPVLAAFSTDARLISLCNVTTVPNRCAMDFAKCSTVSRRNSAGARPLRRRPTVTPTTFHRHHLSTTPPPPCTTYRYRGAPVRRPHAGLHPPAVLLRRQLHCAGFTSSAACRSTSSSPSEKLSQEDGAGHSRRVARVPE